MRTFDSADDRRGLLERAEPAIDDRLCFAHRQRLANSGDAHRLARRDGGVRRALIAGEEPNFERLRAAPIAAIDGCGPVLASLGRADALTMTGRLDVVAARLQRSERVAAGYHLALAERAKRLLARRTQRDRHVWKLLSRGGEQTVDALRRIGAGPTIRPPSKKAARPVRAWGAAMCPLSRG